MSKNDIKTNIVIYGEIEDSAQQWLEWFNKAKQTITNLGYHPSHFGSKWMNKKAGKYKLLNNHLENQLKNELDDSDQLKSLDVLSLPDQFSQEIYDYNIQCIRNKFRRGHYIYISIEKKIFDNLNNNIVENIITTMKEFIQFSNGQIFEMKTTDTPLLYASRMNTPSDYETLKILKEF